MLIKRRTHYKIIYHALIEFYGGRAASVEWLSFVLAYFPVYWYAEYLREIVAEKLSTVSVSLCNFIGARSNGITEGAIKFIHLFRPPSINRRR